jgi:hypothetical protein
MSSDFIWAQQVVHIENRRLAADRQGFSGNVNLNFSFIQNANNIFQLNNNTALQYVKQKHSVISITENNMTIINRKGFINDGFQHFRYNYQISENVIYEGFQQLQYNDVLKMRFRSLTGTGMRFKVLGTDSSRTRLFIGQLFMLEYEEETTGLINRALRASFYSSVGFPISKLLVLDFIGYYQPDVSDYQDFRLSVQGILNIRLTDRLSYSLSSNFVHDAVPPEGIRTTFFSFRNGLRYMFR